MQDMQMWFHPTPPIKSYTTKLETGQLQLAEIYNQKRAEKAKTELGWATPRQKELAYELMTDALKKETCLVFITSFLENDLPAALKKKELAKNVYTTTTSPKVAFSALEQIKLATALTAATRISVEPQPAKAQTSDIIIEPIESGFPVVVPGKEDKFASENQKEVEKPATLKKFAVPRTIVKEVPNPPTTRTTFSLTGIVFASTLYDEIQGTVGKKLTTLVKSNLSDFSQKVSEPLINSASGEENQNNFSVQDAITKGVDPFAPPTSQLGKFAHLGKSKAAKYVGLLMKINKIKDPKSLMADTTIKIPTDPTKKGSPTLEYKVKKGDCLWSIAMQSWNSGDNHKTKMAKAKTRDGRTNNTP
jgi:hypothetical protein